MAGNQQRGFSPFRNEPGEKSNPGCPRGGTWRVPHVQLPVSSSAGGCGGLMGSGEACSSLILGGASARREKINIQFIVFFAKVKTDLFLQYTSR